VKVYFERRKIAKCSSHTRKIPSESHFQQQLSKENFLVCHYLKTAELNHLNFTADVISSQLLLAFNFLLIIFVMLGCILHPFYTNMDE